LGWAGWIGGLTEGAARRAVQRRLPASEMAAGPRVTFGSAILPRGRGPSIRGRSRFTKRRLAGAIIAAGPAVRLHVPRRAISLARGPPTHPTAVATLDRTPWEEKKSSAAPCAGEVAPAALPADSVTCCEDARRKQWHQQHTSRPKIDPRAPWISFFSPGSRGKDCGTPTKLACRDPKDGVISHAWTR